MRGELENHIPEPTQADNGTDPRATPDLHSRLAAAPPGPQTILVINDDEGLTGALRTLLEEDHYTVTLATNGALGLRLAYETRPDLILLDLVRPTLHGMQILRKLRGISDVPIIATGERSAKPALVEGLQLGADDFICVPYAPAEVIARVRAILRRATGRTRWTRRPETLYTVGQMVVDYEARSVTVRGHDVTLTPTEFRLLACLLARLEATVSYRSLTSEVWGASESDHSDYQRHLRLYISYLRQKIESNPSQPEYILTDRRRGYRLASPGGHNGFPG
jgi:two-component system KDP operon response regulator KdpE